VHSLSESAIRRSLVNCSRSEAAALALPRDFAQLDWPSFDVLGWRDPKAELRGYLVHEQEGSAVGIALRAAETRMSARRSAMCLLCRTVQSADAVSLFTARRTGAAGRNGNTVGTYVCADLRCATRVLALAPSAHHLPEELRALAVAEQRAALAARLTGFTADVLRDGDAETTMVR
jgi:treble-clef zinc-finger protein